MQKYYFFYENKILSEKTGIYGITQHQEILLPVVGILLDQAVRIIKS